MPDAVLTEKQIAGAIQELVPTRVAVAYLGVNWKKYLPELAQVAEIVVAPVLGTSPPAVLAVKRELAKIHGGSGWDRIHFLDTLHAKLYLADRGAVYGSANLSDRGLAGDVLEELCRSTHDRGELAALRAFFDKVLAKARKKYPTAQDKMRRLEKLQVETSANPSFARASRGRGTKFADFELLTPDEFYVAWYEPAKNISFDGEALQLRSTIDEDLTLCLVPADKVAEHKWVLCWKTADEGKTATGDLHWIFIDGIAPGGVKAVDRDETPYTTLLYQRVNSSVRASDRPFKLDNAVGRAFKACLENDKQLAKRMRSDRLDMSPQVLPQLIAGMRAHLGLTAP